MSRRGKLLGILLVAASVAVSGVAEARVGGGTSVGSRGARTFSAPPVTQTAPRVAAPIERTATKPSQAGQTSRGGFLGGSSLAGGLLAGFIGAGLFGMLFGHGFLGGLSDLGSIFGFLLQVGLIFLVVRLALNWFNRSGRPAFAGAMAGGGRATAAPQPDLRNTASPARGENARRPNDEIGLVAADFDRFEQLLSEVQTAYGQGDLATLRRIVTPELLDALESDLAANAKRGVVNRISEVKLLRGDLAEAWREGPVQFATVAMRFAIKDVTVERASDRVVEAGPGETTEVWTFRRDGAPRAGDAYSSASWVLSAIQQA